MTMYLEGGAVLYGSDNKDDFNSGRGGVDIEGMQHALVRIMNCKNTRLLGRGVLEGNGKYIRSQGLNASVLKMDESSNVLVEGIISRNSSYWNTLPYRCDSVTILNYKVVNCRPTSTTYNNTDGVNFDECTNCMLYNAFLYCGDDNMAVKNEYLEWNGKPTMNTKNIHHEKVVAYSNSVGCKIGTKTMGESMQDVTFRDIDIIRAGRALMIDAFDNAVVDRTVFMDIRIEFTTSVLIGIENNKVPDWRPAVNQSIVKNTYFTNVASDDNKTISFQGISPQYNIDGIHFLNFTVRGRSVTSQTDPDARWSINSNVKNITFDQKVAVSPGHVTPDTRTFDLYYANSSIMYCIPEKTDEIVSLQMYTMQGRQVINYKIVSERAGYHTINLHKNNSGETLPSGLYLCRLKTKGFTKTINFSVVR
jgi:polygalacturonase